MTLTAGVDQPRFVLWWNGGEMGLYGDLDTMPVEELLRWVEAGRRTGTLEIERDKIVKRLTFRAGRVTRCSTNGPQTLLGQFLLSRGEIGEQALKEAMSAQEATGKNLGEILTETRAVTEVEIARFVEAKIEETLYGLLDSEDGVFRFNNQTPPDRCAVDTDLTVSEILERGQQRWDALKRSRKRIRHSGVVLRRTGRPVPSAPGPGDEALACRILDLIDGTRTVADIQLHSHALEFKVHQILTSFLDRGIVEVEDDRPAHATASAARMSPAVAGADTMPQPARTGPSEVPAAARPVAKRQYRIRRSRPEQDPHELLRAVNAALRHLTYGHPDAALELLDGMRESLPGDRTLAQLVTCAERDFRQKMLAGELARCNVPRRGRPPIEAGQVTPKESFLLGLVDGKNDFKTILWIAPMRDVDALRTLGQMLKKGLIEVWAKKPVRNPG
jgi:hypothetical protein